MNPIEEVERLRACILGLYRELGARHPEVCFDPDCDGTCGLDRHPFEWEDQKKPGYKRWEAPKNRWER